MHLKNSQYQEIMREYDRRQAQHRYELSQRRQTVDEKIPEYPALTEELAGLYAARARRAVLGLPEEAADEASIDRILLKQKSLLKTGGFPEDYLELTYTCPDCHDTGMIGTEKCHCFKQAVVNLLYHQSRIHEILQQENFNSFNMNYYSKEVDKFFKISPYDNMTAIVSQCRDFIRGFDSQHRNLLLYGATGVGKTFLTNCIAKELLDTAHTVIYLSAFQLVDIMQNNTFGNENENPEDESMFDHILDCDLLIIDDLGTEMTNSFVNSQLFLCINQRLTDKRSTIISTNLSLDDLQNQYSERIFSRLVSDYEIMLLMGDDIRIRKAIS